MPRGVKLPRVVIPRATEEIKVLAGKVYSAMEDDPLFDTNEANHLPEGATIKTNLEDCHGELSQKLTTAEEAEADAKEARALLAIKNKDTLDELRNARDLIFALNPTNPMKIVQYGFEAYTSSSDGGNEDPIDPGTEGDDDGGGIILDPA